MSDYQHDRTVTAFYDTRAAADRAVADVVAAGVPHEMASVVAGNDPAARTTSTAATATHDEGFWGTLKNLFAPEEDKYAYAEGLRRGGFLVTVHTSDAHYDHILNILDHEGAVDMNEREAAWKKEGWSGYQATSSTAATAGAATTASGSPVTARDTTSATTGTAAGVRAAERGAAGQETIQLAEEALQVGKRDVNHGRVRLRSYVVEKPVNEAVSLHSERVDVARRPVGPTVPATEAMFAERTISAEEHEEEAVVSKEARVYEEVGLSKTAQDRTQEIKDTVRRTEVEVDDGRGTGARTGLVGESGVAASSLANEIAEHMDVIASDGTHVGTVDHLDGDDRIKLTKSDSADGQHHYIPRGWVDHVDAHVHLSKTANEVRTGWTGA